MTDIEAYKATLSRMERDLAKAVATAEKLRAGIAAVKDILGEATVYPSAESRAIIQLSGDRVPQGLTMKGLAIWALTKRFPLRIREMHDLLAAHGWEPPADYEQFRGSMAPTLNRQSIFRKVGPGLFTLDMEALQKENEKTQNAGSTLGLL